jgi:hypothetical protein
VEKHRLALWVLILGAASFGACGVDETTNGDGGVDATSDVVNDGGAEAAKDSATDAGSDVVASTCEGGVACGIANDCPITPTCVARTCPNGCCGTAFEATGVPCTEDGGHVCDGTGKCVACNTGTDCPKTVTLCQVAGCTTNVCNATNAAVGTPCTDDGGKVCDGTGVCVACIQPSDCPAQTTTCKTSTCAQSTCGASFTAIGTTCKDNGGQVCDGVGSCVQCNTTIDCVAINDSGVLVCVNNHCQ